MDSKEWKKLFRENKLNEEFDSDEAAEAFSKVYDQVLGKGTRNKTKLSNADVNKIKSWVEKKYKIKLSKNDLNDVLESLLDYVFPDESGERAHDVASKNRKRY